MAILRIRKPDGGLEEVPALVGSSGKSAYAYAVENGYTGTEEEFAALLGRLTALDPKTPTSIDLTALDPVKLDDGRLMGYIVETFGEEDGAPTETTELTYDDAGNIVSIKTADGHVTELKWKEAE